MDESKYIKFNLKEFRDDISQRHSSANITKKLLKQINIELKEMISWFVDYKLGKYIDVSDMEIFATADKPIDYKNWTYSVGLYNTVYTEAEFEKYLINSYELINLKKKLNNIYGSNTI
jgi:hypothetical protein